MAVPSIGLYVGNVKDSRMADLTSLLAIFGGVFLGCIVAVIIYGVFMEWYRSRHGFENELTGAQSNV